MKTRRSLQHPCSGEDGKGTYTYRSLALYRQSKILNDGGVKLLFRLDIAAEKRQLTAYKLPLDLNPN